MSRVKRKVEQTLINNIYCSELLISPKRLIFQTVKRKQNRATLGKGTKKQEIVRRGGQSLFPNYQYSVG